MAIRCGCPAQGDETVFGPRHECTAVQPVAIPAPPEQPWETTLAPDELED